MKQYDSTAMKREMRKREIHVLCKVRQNFLSHIFLTVRIKLNLTNGLQETDVSFAK